MADRPRAQLADNGAPVFALQAACVSRVDARRPCLGKRLSFRDNALPFPTESRCCTPNIYHDPDLAA
jgi:hypothetical protein